MPKSVIKPNSIVQREVKKHGYQIFDYQAGLASTPDGKRKIKIGKLLTNPATIKIFANDPLRSASKTDNQLVVISRHPYDIAGMSTDRGWTSCMNLEDGENKAYVSDDVNAGTLIAYLINGNDKNIEHPIARVLIKPFVNLLDKNEVALGVSSKVYGSASNDFKKAVVKWADDINDSRKLDGIFKFPKDLYNDEDNVKPKAFGTNAENYKNIIKDPIKYLTTHPNLPEKLKVIIVGLKPDALRYIDNPSSEVQLAAVNRDANAIKFIRKPSLEILLYAINQNGSAIRNIKNPPLEIQLAAVRNKPYALSYIKQPAIETQILAVSQDGSAIEWIDFPSLEVQLAAVKNDPKAIDFIRNPLPEVIRKIKNASKRIHN